MAVPLMYAEDHYVLLRPHCGEEFLTAAEMLSFLTTIVLERGDELPADLLPKPIADHTANARDIAQSLLDRTCELNFAAGDWLQWYAVRLERE